jgi:hypothetical protein
LRRVVGLQDAHRVRIKGEHHRRAARSSCVIARLTDNALMAPVDAVKHSNRQVNFLKLPGNFFKCAKDLHRVI